MSSRENPCIVCMAVHAMKNREEHQVYVDPAGRRADTLNKWVDWYQRDQPKVGACSPAHEIELAAALLRNETRLAFIPCITCGNGIVPGGTGMYKGDESFCSQYCRDHAPGYSRML